MRAWHGCVLLLSILGAGCVGEAPPATQTFDGVVQVRDLTASGGRVFVANDIAPALAQAPGAVPADHLHDLVILSSSAAGTVREGFLDAPTDPKRLFARRIVVDEGRQRAYFGLGAGAGEGWVEILDVADPTHPTPLHLLPLAEVVVGLAVSNDVLFIASPDGLHVYDVSDPSAPKFLADYAPDDNDGVADVKVVNGRAYLAATGGGLSLYPRLLVLDVADPAHPTLLGEQRIVSGFNGIGLAVEVRGDRAYLLGDIGLDVFDVSVPSAIARLGSVPTSATQPALLYVDLAMIGDVALIAFQGNGLEAVDLGNPMQPLPLTTYPDTSAPANVVTSVAVTGENAFVALSKSGIHIVSVDDDGDGVLTVTDNCPSVANPTQADVDFDGVGDACDDCIDVADFDQADADGDGYGNRCDPDLDGNGIVSFGDLALLRAAFFKADPVADLNVDGVVNFADLARMKQRFFGKPGPSALAPPQP